MRQRDHNPKLQKRKIRVRVKKTLWSINVEHFQRWLESELHERNPGKDNDLITFSFGPQWDMLQTPPTASNFDYNLDGWTVGAVRKLLGEFKNAKDKR